MSARKPSPAELGSRSGLELVDEIEVRIEKLVTGGDGLGRWRGVPIFVPRSVPGELVRARLTERRPDYGRGEVVEILEAGDGRRTARCRHFGVCGGCDLQHIEDTLQTRLRSIAVEETLARIGGIRRGPALEVIADSSWSYRQRAQFHVQPAATGLRVGYRKRRAGVLVELEECPILVPELQDLLPRLRTLLPSDPPKRLDVLAGDGGALSVAPRVHSLPHGDVGITVGEIEYELDARVFFQAHRGLLPKLIDSVVGDWQGEEAFDLYAGVGFFSLPLARRYTRVSAVEGDRIAGRYLQRNARRNRLAAIDFLHSAVESWVPRLPDRAERVVVDPPRQGLSLSIRERLCHQRPRRLTYVSCHPAALARDLRSLTRYFEIESITALDMFPQTGHMEVVVQMTT